MSDLKHPIPASTLGRIWLIGWLVVGAMLFGLATSNSGTASVRPTEMMRPTKAIESVALGERVHVESPKSGHRQSAEVDMTPEHYRQIELSMHCQAGMQVDVSLLRSIAWITDHGVIVGTTIPISLSDAGLSGTAEVLAIGNCPTIDAGSGRIVTGLFTHVRGGIVDLTLAGQSTSIGVTENHPVYSVDRSEFVAAGQLELGEQVYSLEGVQFVAALQQRELPERVYNLEIEGEHVYHVGDSGLLVHNNCETEGGSGINKGQPGEPGYVEDVVPEAFTIRVRPGIDVGRPDTSWAIDSNQFTRATSRTARGFARNQVEFWDLWTRQRPETLSDMNLDFMQGRHPVTGQPLEGGFKSPIVDDVWIRYFPEHRQFKGQTLEHHHVDGGRWAIPLPEILHRGAPDIFHK